ncbi:MAG: DUF1848 domain-containing protein [Candidatus Riflebacteria bacterium]|nr:DUF1848 domain-containing protein [Candidatus Riflebacteria bacterium]
MIVSASYKTDIPALYGEWFRNRLKAGFCRVRNPYGGQVSTVSLTGPEVDGFVFWTRNLTPFAEALEEVAATGVPFVVTQTMTGYPRALETSVPPPERSVRLLSRVRARYGPAVVVWRYDPIVFSSLTTAAWHLANFGRLAAAMEGVTDEVVVSFAQVYQKTRRNLDGAASRLPFVWWDPPDDEKRSLLVDLAAVAREHGLRLSLCAQRWLLLPGVADASCIDPRRLSAVAGRTIEAEAKPHRKECGCFRSKDIGAYDTCTLGCSYCYAVQSRAVGLAHRRAHDPGGEFLFPPAPATGP